MTVPSPRGESFERLSGRQTRLLVLGVAALAFGSWVAIPSVSAISVGTVTSTLASRALESIPELTVFAPLLLGLAASGGPDRGTALERLATDLETFVAQFTDDGPDETIRNGTKRDGAGESDGARTDLDGAERVRDAGTTFELERDDELGRLSAAIEDLTTAVRERERQFDARERQFQARERELQATNERFGAIIEASPAAIVAVDLEGTVELWNPAAERIFGWSAAEIRGEPLPIIPDDRTDEVDRFRERLEADESVVGYETKRRRRDGSVIDVSLSKAPLHDADGNVVGAMAALEDITERKETERQLRERERRLQTYASFTDDLLDTVDDVFCVIDEDGDVQRWNESLPQVTGYSDGEIGSMHALEFFAEHDEATIADAIDEVLETGSARVEASVVTSDGESIPYEFVASRLEDLDGNPVVTGVGRDISERKRYERELERTTELLGQAQTLASVGGWELDIHAEPYTIAATDELLRQLGLEPGAPIELDAALERFHPDDRPLLREAVEDIVENGESYDLEARLQTADGEERWMHTIGEPVFANGDGEGDGEAVAVRGSMQDITEQTERERQLREHERQLSTLMSNVPGMVYRCRNEPDWPMEFVSEGCLELTGYEPEAIERGIVCWGDDVMVENDADVWEVVQELLDARNSFQFVYPIETADGERRWVSERGRGVVAEDGSLEALEGVIIDVTERIENERQLERTTRLLEQSQRLANIGAWELDVRDEPHELQWTDEVARIHGVSPDDDVDLADAIAFYHPDDRAAIRSALESAIEAGESYDLELRLISADGDQRWVRSIGEPVRERGTIVKIQGSFQDVTERKRRERELERYETIIQAIGDPVYTLDESGEFTFVNDAIEPLAGHDPETMIGEDVSEFMATRDLERARELVRDLLREDEPYETFEMALETADGDVIEAENHVALLPMDDGEFAGTAGVVRDITERKERERELERSTELLEQAQRIAGVGGWDLDVTTDPYDLTLTAELQQLFRREQPSERERSVADAIRMYHPDDRPRVLSAVDAAVEDGESYDLEVRMYTADGEERWMRTIGEPVFANDNGQSSGDGEVVAVRGSVQDITERKERERDLERTTDLLDRVQQLAAVGGWEMDVQAESRPETWTEELYRLHDVPRHVTPDLELAIEGYHPDDRAFVRERIETAIAAETGYEFEARLQTDAGESRWVRAMGEPIYDDGDLVKYRGSVQDITERKERERDLERTTDLLERVQRMAKVGGWEMDVDAEPRVATWTDELYRLHGLSRDVAPTLESTLECYHPDDRPFVRNTLRTAMDTEREYDYEARLGTDSDDLKWVRAIGEPIYDADGELVKFRGSVEDISEQKRRELALESLHDTARELLNVETEPAVAELVVETAGDLLDSGSAGVYLLDSETNRFEPTASTPDFAERSGGAPSVAVGNGDSVLWNTYVTGTQTVVDDAEIGDRSPLFGGDVPGGLLVPIGDHGVFVLVAPPDTIGDETRRLVETLVATTEAAFDRLESEASLRERDAELAARNRRLRRQIQVTEIIRGIDRSLVGADSRTEIERTVPERLVEADNVAFAWIGDLDASGTTLEPRAWAGTEPEYLDAVSFGLETGANEPAVRTARSETPTVVENVVEGLQDEPWRRSALDAGFQSVVSVPLSFEEYSYGVLTVYADEPDAFTDLERSVFAELGEGIANATNAAKTQEALHAETLVELALELEGDDDVLSRIASATGATVSYEGLGADSGSETVLFFETAGVAPADVRDVLDDLVSVTDSRLVTESDDNCLFEATVTGAVVASRLVRHGASPRSITADGDRTAVTVDVPTTTDVREFVEMLDDHYATVTLRSRRHVTRATHTRQELVTSLFDDLTDRQLEVLRTAYLAGFFEWPRESTGEEIAEMLEVTQPTVNRHLRIGQQRLLAQLFENGALSLVDEA